MKDRYLSWKESTKQHKDYTFYTLFFFFKGRLPSHKERFKGLEMWHRLLKRGRKKSSLKLMAMTKINWLHSQHGLETLNWTVVSQISQEN